jgi:UDP-2,3-diacylglucosamine pyrophosphatase LpxH
MRQPPLIIVSDLHLDRGGDTEVTRDLADLIVTHAGHEILLNGDVLNLSTEPPGFEPTKVVGEYLTGKTVLLRALREHLLRGDAVTVLAGNHDAVLGLPAVEREMRRLLAVHHAAPLACLPWFARRGRVHVEHGHLYDADNAPNHPLVAPTWRTEPLGIAITRRFLAPHGALEFCHRHDTTPMAGLRRVFALYGPRAPKVVLGYFAYAARQCRSVWHKRRLLAEQLEGQHQLASYAVAQGVDPDAVSRLLQAIPHPTHHRLRRTFARLYLDRVVASVGSVGGAAVLVAGAPMSGLLLAGAGTTYLGASLARGKNRYAGIVELALRDAALRIADTTGAEMVVMGHTHDEDYTPVYVNTGSFAYPNEPGRPFVQVDAEAVVSRRRWCGANRGRHAA